jgi:phosphatidylglycerophosphatase A
VGIPLAAQIERVGGEDDPSFVTIDEFAGQFLAMASPIIIANPYWVVLCFFVFRVFDISKLWPASAVERRGGGVGIMGDDMVAGLYANVASHLIFLGAMYVGPVAKFLTEG